MATHEPSSSRLQSLAYCNINKTNDVYSIRQLSIGDSYDSTPTTSNHRTFSCQINANSNGSLLFPLAKNINIQTSLRHNLLNYLKSQLIVENIEIFKEIKTQQKYLNDTQQFPLNARQKKNEKFPVKNNLENSTNRQDKLDMKRQIFLPGKVIIPEALLAKNIQALKGKEKSNWNIKILGQNRKKLQFQRVKRFSKTFSNRRAVTSQANHADSMHNKLNASLINTEVNNKFLVQLFKTKARFPLIFKYENAAATLTHEIEVQQNVKPLRNIKNFEGDASEMFSITRFPCQMFTFGCVTKFPINTKCFFAEHSLSNDLNNGLKKNISKNFIITNSSPSLLLGHRNIKNAGNEHVFQVQDTQEQAMENPQSFTMVEENNKQMPTQTFLATVKYDSDEHEHEDIHKLSDINSINNSHVNEVGYYEEKIERFQDAIISLFEKLQNSLIKNHKNNHESTKNATKRDEHDNKGNTRFALTPPMSLTSVQNTESINNDHTEVPPYEKFDLDDLCVEQIVDHIVECSEVRDTLTEAVDCANTKSEINSTGSFLVKSEEPISPYTLDPQQPFNQTDNTSLEINLSVRDLLLSNDKHLDGEEKNNFKSDSSKINFNQIDFQNGLSETVVITSTLEHNWQKQTTNEMTVTRSNKNDQAKASQIASFPTHKAIEHENNILVNKKNSNEMKFEMHKIKGALPSSATERASSKHDNYKTLNNSTTSNNRFPLATNTSKSYNDSSYASRSAIKNDIPHLTSKTFNNPNSEPASQRRPSLGALRNTQSTSQLSVDLPRYTPLATTKPLLNNPAASFDASLSDVLPERTRLRRQRRLRAQDSQDEPENAIERLNLLRARISASLSEVKGVLKQYSTDPDNENATQIVSTTNTTTEAKEDDKKKDDKKEGPVTFRFVKKVRRRSLFLEDGEKQQKELTISEAINENQLENQDETDHCKVESDRTGDDIIDKKKYDKTKDEQNKMKVDNKTILMETAEIKPRTDLNTLKEENQEAEEKEDQTEKDNQLPVASSDLNKPKEADEPLEFDKEIKTSHTTFDKEMLKPEEKTAEQRLTISTELSSKSELQGAIPKLIISNEQTKTTNDNISEAHRKLKKKIIIKTKETLRRASVAAVEGSKIEPALQIELPNRLQRRPSDSEALVKKKLLTAKLNTSGAVEEVTPKPKSVKVRKSSLKNHTNNSTHLATMQMKLQNEDFALTAANIKSDEQNKSLNKENKSITCDKNQDVLMTKQEHLETPEQQQLQQQQQQQLKNEIASQTNSWLPTQLVIDEAASFNKKTIENSVLTPRQHQPEQEQDHQATIDSTATNFKSNDLQAKGAMLENVRTVISSSATNEADGHLTRENIDLLQFEIDFLNKPTTTYRSNDDPAQLTNKVENIQTKVNTSTTQSKENLETHQTTNKEQQHEHEQLLATENQQVLKTTATEVIKHDDNNNSKHEDFKATATLKKPCEENTTTSTHVDQTQQQQQQEQLQREEGKQSTTSDTKTISCPHNSISCTSDITPQTSNTSELFIGTAEISAAQLNKMPELKLAPSPVQTAEIISQPDHKKKIIYKKIIRQSSVDKTKKTDSIETKSPQETQTQKTEATIIATQLPTESPQIPNKAENSLTEQEQVLQLNPNDLTKEGYASLGSEVVPSALGAPKKERIVKKKVIIKRQKRRLSIGDNFFHTGNEEEQHNAAIETLEKAIAFVSDDEAQLSDERDQETQSDQETAVERKPLKSCILRKEYNVGDEVLFAERFKKTQIKWRRGRIKERITSISYLLDIDGKDVSSHINYLKKFTGRKVSFGGKEYLEIDYEQLAEEEEKAERLKKRTYSIWNMV